MKLQFLNSIPLEVISGGNIYNHNIIEGLRHQHIEVDYNTFPLDDDYDFTIVDSLFMTPASIISLRSFSSIIALIHQLPKLDNSAVNFLRTRAKFIVTGNSAKEQLISDWQINDESIQVIRPGISRNWKSKSTFNHKPKRIVVIANFVQHKGFEMLVSILKHLRFSDLDFHVIGNNTLDKTYAENIVKSIQETKANVEFHFNNSRDEVYNQLVASDMLLSLSKFETFGMAIFEALSLGLPSLAFKTGDFNYFRQYSNYIMIEEYSENAFIELIDKLVGNSKTYESYCNKTSQDRREWANVINEFSSYLKTIQ